MTGMPLVDLNQKFPALAKPPIVEAMITFVARARTEWTPESVTKRIVDALPDYSTHLNMNQARFSFALQAGGPAGAPPPANSAVAEAENIGWMGLRLVSQDQRQVVTAARDNLSLSWLGEYVGWTRLSSEMMRLWEIHRVIAGVDSIDQIQIRYVNRLEVPGQDFDPAIYFAGFGSPPEGLARGPFLHQDTLGHSAFPWHMLNLIRTFEPLTTASPNLPILVVLEAANAEPIPAENSIITERLIEMHWLKNYSFFKCVTDAYLDLCR